MRADYNLVDRLLHRVALGSRATAEVLHDLERSLYLKHAPPDEGGHVFVTGLARAGTTILLRELHATGEFGSLTYADMPLVLAPNLWARVSGGMREGFDPVERAHGDGIAVGLDSPEAFDEAFWRVTRGEAYLHPHGVLVHRPGRKTIARYRDFIRLALLRTGKPRYLAKGNNNIARLDALAAGMADCTFLLAIREPRAHAASLLRQHRRFAGEEDRFRRAYMGWLAHHEFGVDHRPFRFPGAPEGDADSLDYWLATWLAVYSALEITAAAHANILVVPHESLCNDPAFWPTLCARLGLDAAPLREAEPVSEKAAIGGRSDLEEQTDALYCRSLERAREQLATRR